MTTANLGRLSKKEIQLAKDLWDNIKERENDLDALFTRMDSDLKLFTLEQWVPDEEEPISAADAYTTNQLRVLAKKIISFITSTELVTRIPNDEADDQQEDINDKTEKLAIGMLNNADKLLRRAGQQSVQDQLGWYSVVRGGWAAVRAMLRKDAAGQTFVDILPIDPRHLVLQVERPEIRWAAHRFIRTRKEILREYPGFKWDDGRATEEAVGEECWEFVRREPNPQYDPFSPNPFDAHPWIYEIGTIINGQWARRLHRVYCFMFPIIAIPVDEQPMLVPTNQNNDKFAEIASFGESIFADDREIVDKYNRWMSYNLTMAGKAVDPQTKVRSLDGTKALDDGVNEKGSEINLSSANDEDVELMEVPDARASTQIVGQALNIDMVAGGLPPQSFGLLDKPLSGVALSQLGQNLEQKVAPRMKAVARCIESALELMVGQYETGAFEPFTVSGTRSSLTRFANQRIGPEQVLGHDPIEVTMELALPQDETTRWTVAQMALQPIAPDGAPLMSKEWVLEKILKIQSPKTIFRQNLERLAHTSIPVAQLWEMLQMALAEGNQFLASALYDQLRIAIIQQQLQGSVQLQQLGLVAQGVGIDIGAIDQQIQTRLQGTGTNQSLNPANGAIPFAQAAGVGNQPSPEAGYNTTADRNTGQGPFSGFGGF